MAATGQRSGTLTDADLMAMGSHGIARSYPKNTVIVSEGDRTDSLYVILEGRVKVYVSDDDGHDVVLATQGAGEYFGELVLAMSCCVRRCDITRPPLDSSASSSSRRATRP